MNTTAIMAHSETAAQHEIKLCIRKMTFFKWVFCRILVPRIKYGRWINIVHVQRERLHRHTHRLSTRINLRIKNPLWIAYVILKITMGLPQWCPLALLKQRRKKKLLPACATSNFVQCLFVTNRSHLVQRKTVLSSQRKYTSLIYQFERAKETKDKV